MINSPALPTLSFLFGATRAGFAIAVTPNLALAGSAIASAHDDTPQIAANPAEWAGNKP